MDIDEPVGNSTFNFVDIRSILLEHLSLNNEAHFKSQQRGDPDLTQTEKRQIAEAILMKDPGNFLLRFGKYLLNEHLDYFSPLAMDNYEVNFVLNDLRSKFSKKNGKSVVRNRRLEAVRRLTIEGEYFSDDEMRKRNPAMFEHLVGQYLTDEEKRAVQSNKSETESFLAVLLKSIEEKEIEDRLLRDSIEEVEEESDSDEDYMLGDSKQTDRIILWGEHSSNEHVRLKKDVKNIAPMTDNEKALLMNEFRSHVYSEFLGGRDSEFDYTVVDSNNDYDDLDMLEIDQQDQYFDSETPEMVSKGDASSDSSISFDPPRSLIQRMEDLGK